ncbi:MAG: hypothetical protein Fur0032_19130 [Terrimicrobiaceae bacterium]
MRPETSRKPNVFKRAKRYFFHPYRGRYRRRRWIYFPLAGVAVFGTVTVMVLFGRPEHLKSSPKAVVGTAFTSAQGPVLKQNEEMAKVVGLLNEGAQALADGDIAAAVAAFSAAAAIDPSRTEAWNGVGLSLLARGKAADALLAFERAVRLDTTDARGYANRALALRVLDRLPEAIASAKESTRLDPSNPLYSNRYFLMRIQNGEEDAVRSEVRSAALLKIENIEASSVVAAAALDLIGGEQASFRDKLERAKSLLPQATLSALLDDPVLAPYADNIRGQAGLLRPTLVGGSSSLP